MHQHTGMANLTFWAGAKGNLQHVCTSRPHVDKTGRLLEQSSCRVGAPNGDALPAPVVIKKGEQVMMASSYHQDDMPHYGVMAYLVLSVHRL